MRRKPVSRDEVRLGGGQRYVAIVTMPENTVRQDGQGYLHPIRELWAPLVRKLNHSKRQRWESPEGQENRKEFLERWGGPDNFKPVEYPQPFLWGNVPDCRHCGNKFYRTEGYRGFYCSDRCQNLADAPRRAVRIARFVKARSKWRAEFRETDCVHCGKPIEAKRSTMRFCSVKCRVAEHRAKP